MDWKSVINDVIAYEHGTAKDKKERYLQNTVTNNSSSISFDAWHKITISYKNSM